MNETLNFFILVTMIKHWNPTLSEQDCLDFLEFSKSLGKSCPGPNATLTPTPEVGRQTANPYGHIVICCIHKNLIKSAFDSGWVPSAEDNWNNNIEQSQQIKVKTEGPEFNSNTPSYAPVTNFFLRIFFCWSWGFNKYWNITSCIA